MHWKATTLTLLHTVEAAAGVLLSPVISPRKPARRGRATESEAQANLLAALVLAAEGKLRTRELSRRPTPASVRAMGAVLVDGDFYDDEPIAAFAWPLLLQSAGLARSRQNRLELTADGRAALHAPEHETIRHLWNSWIAAAVIDEFRRINRVKGQDNVLVVRPGRARRRTVDLALRSCLPPAEWIEVDHLFAAVRQLNLSPTIARGERGMRRLHIGDPQHGSLHGAGSLSATWNVAEGRYLLAMLFEYAGTLGMLDLDYVSPVGARADFRHWPGTERYKFLSRYDGLRAVRVNALGRFVLGMDEEYRPGS